MTSLFSLFNTLISDLALVISVLFMGVICGLFLIGISFIAVFSFTTSLRQTWRKNRIQKTTLPAGRRDVSHFPSSLFDKKYEALFPSIKPTFTKKDLKEYIEYLEKNEENIRDNERRRREMEERGIILEGGGGGEGGEEGEFRVEGGLWLKAHSLWLPRFGMAGMNGRLSFFSSEDDNSGDDYVIGQINLKGCVIVFDKTDKENKTLTITHTSNIPIFCVSVDGDLSSQTLQDALSFGTSNTATIRFGTTEKAQKWKTVLESIIETLPPWGYVEKPHFPFFKRGNVVQDVKFLGVLLDRIFADIQTSSAFQADIHKTIKKKIDALLLPSFVGPIVIEKIDTGKSFVELDRCAFQKAASKERKDEFMIQLKGKYNGGAGVDLSTELVLTENLRVSLDLSVRIKSCEGIVNIFAPHEKGELWSLYLPKPLNPDTFSADVNIKIGGINVCYLIPSLKPFLNSCVYRAIGFVLTWPGRVTLCLPFPGRKFDPEPEPYQAKMKIKRIGPRRQRPTDSDDSQNIDRKFVIGQFFHEIFWKKEVDAIDELFDKNATITGLLPYFYTGKWDIMGRSEMKNAVRHILNAFSDLRVTIVDLEIPKPNYGNPNIVHCRFRLRAKHDTNPFWSIPPSGKRIVLEGLLFTELNTEHKIVDQNWYWAPSSLLALFPKMLDPQEEELEKKLVEEGEMKASCKFYDQFSPFLQ